MNLRPSRPAPRRLPALLGALAAALLAACAQTPEVTTVSVAELSQRPAEHALLDGLRNYDNGAFDAAAASLTSAVQLGLRDPRDRAVAYKYLAFIDCAFNRIPECEAHFRLAFAADPKFHLTDAEIGHPIWGPVYRRVAAVQAQSPAAR